MPCAFASGTRTFPQRISGRGAAMPGQRILLVEDEPEIGDMLALFLRGEGYAVDVARTLAQGRARLDALPYSLVIADLRLPDGSGLEVVDRAAELGKAEIGDHQRI